MVEYSRDSGYRLRLGEVSVTELNFYKLRHFWTQGVYIDTDEPNETKTGADWEWIIGHADKWLQIRIQAKIINRNGSFTELGHPPRNRREQMDRLIDPAAGSLACRWMPLYVFYTANPPAPIPGTSNRDHGCSAKLARQVRDVYGPSPFSGRANLRAGDHLQGSLAWSSIFDGLVSRLQQGESFGAIIDSLANKRFPEDATSIHQFWDSSRSDGLCVEEPPEYVKEITARRSDDFQSADLARLEVKAPPKGDKGKQPDSGRESRPDEQQHPDTETQPSPGLPRGFKKHDFKPLPTRYLQLKSPDTAHEEIVSMPSLVSVIDIDRLPETP